MRLINSNVVFVSADAPVHDAVAEMKDRAISSVLVADKDDQVVGIVTERDIVHHFTLLDVQGKLERLVNTIMSRPVGVARLGSLVDDVIELHFERKIRHFPVVRDPTRHDKSNVVGIVSITDVARNYLHTLRAHGPAGTQKIAASRPLFILAHQSESFEAYREIFSSLGYTVARIADEAGLAILPKAGAALLIDMDDVPVPELTGWLKAMRNVKVPVIFATSQEALLEPFKRQLSGQQRDIALKPVNVSYCHWMLSNWLR